MLLDIWSFKHIDKTQLLLISTADMSDNNNRMIQLTDEFCIAIFDYNKLLILLFLIWTQ